MNGPCSFPFLCISSAPVGHARFLVRTYALLFSIPVHAGSGVTSLMLPGLVVPLRQVNSTRRTHSPFPILEPLHGQPSELLPKREGLLDGEQMG